jgi:hypothetical protein
VDCRKYHPALWRQAVSLLSQSLGAAHILTLRGDYNREKCLLQLLAIKLSRNVVASPDLSGCGNPVGWGGLKAEFLSSFFTFQFSFCNSVSPFSKGGEGDYSNLLAK